MAIRSFGIAVFACLSALPAATALAQAPPPADLAETREIEFGTGLDCTIVTAQYNGCALLKKANELATPVQIYEYVRNTIEYAPYHGSRSNSTNTFLGRRGSDVDTASVLIAMLRARGIPARYVTGKVQTETAKVTGWLNVQNVDLAVSVLKDQGIQQVALNGTTIEMEHTWVEALVPYANYRAAGPDVSSVNCAAQRTQCRWVSLAPAFKVREQGTKIDIYSSLLFPYEGYYNAMLTSDPAFLEKNPLEIYEEQILSHLRTAYPGKTLEDVSDAAPIVKEVLAILPNSLPFKVLTATRSYNSVVEHDQASPPSGTVELKRWAKFVTITATIQTTDGNGFAGAGTQKVFTSFTSNSERLVIQNGIITLPLSILTTTRLALAFRQACDETCPVTADLMVGNITLSNGIGNVSPGTLFYIKLQLDGAPGATSTMTDQVITANYANNVIGGYYLIGTGGDTSNWSQMHRSASQLLAANDQYVIVKDPETGIPYVDTNGNGAFDAQSDVQLRFHTQAMNDLNGGLLYAAMNLYYARFYESIRRLDSLNHVITPLGGFIGIVSSVYDVDYVDGTAFSVMPGGLLIDMKGIQFNGSWRTNAPATYAEEHFKLTGHVGSSLEHEIWQELTGFDAISTVRGIQMALKDWASLLEIRSQTLDSYYWALGFQVGAAPAGFTLRETDFYDSPVKLASWEYPNAGSAAFEMFKRTVTSAEVSGLRGAGVSYLSTNGFDDFLKWADARDLFYKLKMVGNSGGFTAPDENFNALPCSPTQNPHKGTYSKIYQDLKVHIDATLNNCFNGELYGAGEDDEYALNQFSALFVNEGQGFVPSEHAYRIATPWNAQQSVNEHSAPFVMSLRNQVYALTCKDNTNTVIPCKKEFTLPSKPTRGASYKFTVYIDKRYETSVNKLTSLGFLIQNQSFAAGGGWVNGDRPREQHRDTTGSIFNNEVFTDQNLNAQANNDLVTTPSTVDPVSTVTGNMYHDETDVVLKGRGLDYSFTRTYNSGPTKAKIGDGPLGPGWTHSYNMRLVSNDYGRYPNYPSTVPYEGYTGQVRAENANGRTSSITYIDERGGEVNYLLDDVTETYAVTLPRGVFNALALNTPVPGQHTLTFRNGVKYVFESPDDLKSPGKTARLALILDPYGNQLTLSYNGNGRLESVTDNLNIAGRTGLRFTYELISGKLDTVSDWQGRTWSYDYDDGRLASAENPREELTNYTYHGDTALLNQIIRPQDRGGKRVTTTFRYYRNNRAFDYTNILGQAETLDYDLYRKRTRVTDPRGFIREHYYDEDGALTRLEEPDGGILLFSNNDNGLRCSKTDGMGYQTWYKYATSTATYDDKACGAADAFGNVTREIDALGRSTSYTYDFTLFDQITSIKNKRGFTWAPTYYGSTDATSGAVRGKMHKVFSPLSASVPLREFTYYANGNVKQQVEYIDLNNISRKRVTDFFYDPSGLNLMEKHIGGAGVTIRTTFTYDVFGRKETETLHRRKSAIDATVLQLTTKFDYDELDRVVKVTDPLGNIAETIYDANGRVTDEKVHYKLPNGTFDVRAYAHHDYDAADRRIKTTDIEGLVTSFEYDASGNLVAVADPNKHITRYEYDSMNRRIAVIAANGYRTQMVYDLAGRLLKSSDANGNGSTMEYDPLGRKAKVKTAMGYESRMEYDENGNVSKIIDANAVAGAKPTNGYNATVYNEYDALDRITLSVDALNGAMRYTYDLLGNRLTIEDAEQHTTTMVYDDLGRLIEVHDPVIETPIDRISKLTYDEAGNVLTATDRKGDVVRHTYDALNRLTLSEHLTDGTQEVRAYNVYGNMEAVSNQAVTYTYTYDAKNRMKRKTDSRLNKSLSWTYDPAGLIRTKTDYQGEVTTYQYDSANRLVAQVNPGYVQVSYHYDPAGRLVDRILSNGARTHYRYDADNRLTGLTNYSPGGEVIHSQTYGYDRLRNVEGITDGGGSRPTSMTRSIVLPTSLLQAL
jgi:YD repeat-containing protein